MVWYPFLGYGIFWVSLIVAIILYAIKRKWSPLVYMISVSLYIFTVGFVIDIFELKKNGVLLILFASALIMILLGWYLSKKLDPLKTVKK
ncbi:MAG: hypothetical protein AABW41_05375 [Nanoarchaeota archaeon]